MNYPGSNTEVKPGDVIYSSKSIGTFYVGHIGIVGPDYYVYHSHANRTHTDGGKKAREQLVPYLNFQSAAANVRVLRAVNTKIDVVNVANAALSIFRKIQRYDFDINLNKSDPSYCSKFVWQAYWFATGLDCTNKGYTHYTQDWVLPSELKNSSFFKPIYNIYNA